MNRPNTYRDWRRLWHELARELGWEINHRIRMGEPLMCQYVWKLSRQLDRVRLRLDAEVGACTSDYCTALLDAIMREKG